MKKLSSLANLTTGVSHGIITTDLDKIRLLADNIDSILTMLNSLSGGVEAQVLTKRSSALLDYGWSAPTGGSSGGSSGEVTIPEGEFCPGYAFTRVDADSITSVLDLDLTSLFSEGRRVRITDGGVVKYGAIDTRTYSTGTTINFIMEDAATIDANPSEVCLTSSVTSWVPVTNPFIGAINDLCTGVIGLTRWWFAVGVGGQIAVSRDKGVTWASLAIATAEDLTCCTYDSIHQTFWAGGTGGIVVSTEDCVNITQDTTSIPAFSSSSNHDIGGISHSAADDSLYLLYRATSTTQRPAYTLNQGASWDTEIVNGGLPPNTNCIKVSQSSFGDTTTRIGIASGSSSSYTIEYYGDSSYSVFDNIGGGNIISASIFFWDGTGTVRVYGTETGWIEGYIRWTGNDIVSFTSRINSFAYSPLHSRLVCVGDNATVGYWDIGNKTINDSWVPVASGFSPTANINAVVWDENDRVFIAVADNGQICRSTNGTS